MKYAIKAVFSDGGMSLWYATDRVRLGDKVQRTYFWEAEEALALIRCLRKQAKLKGLVPRKYVLVRCRV